MQKYKNMLCPDCQTVLGKIWPLEYGQVRLQLHCKKCKAEQRINVEVKAVNVPHNGTSDLQETHRVFVG